MATNFQFLKKVNKDLYEIISEAEKLYRDEYFEQCMAQTRRFGEQVCKNMLEENNKQTGSFDEMLTTLKENSSGNVQEKEFIDDLYFLKKNGNQSVHSGKVKKDALNALECLKRSFEIAINYSVYNQGANTNILRLNYDVELLITENKQKKSLKEKYKEAREKENIKERETPSLLNYNKKAERKLSLFWTFILFLTIVSVCISLFLLICVQVLQHSS